MFDKGRRIFNTYFAYSLILAQKLYVYDQMKSQRFIKTGG